MGWRVGLEALEKRNALVFAVGRNKDSSAVQSVENARYAILVCNLSDITSNVYVVTRFVIICLEAVRHISLIDCLVLHHPMKFNLSVSYGSLGIVIKYTSQNNFLKVPYCSTFYKNITVIKVSRFSNMHYNAAGRKL